MGLFARLRSLFVRTEATPPRIEGTFTPSGLDRADDRELLELIDLLEAHDDSAAEDRERSNRPQRLGEDLWGITFAIEYIDAKGTFSSRRITMRNVYQKSDGDYYVTAHCHERNALRSFRIDRIASIIDMDGVVHEPFVFFRDELQVELEPRRSAPAAPVRTGTQPLRIDAAPAPKPGHAQRHIARDGLRVLVAMARADGLLHPRELEIILAYIAAKAERHGALMGDVDRLAIAAYLKRQRPGEDVLERCLDALEDEAEEDQLLFLDSVLALMDADGVQDEGELALLAEIRDRLSDPTPAASI